MAWNSSIEWTESTWNPVTGCTKISPGCKNCYAERFSKRLQAMGSVSYRNGFQLTIHPNILEWPLKRKKPQIIFVNSMSDLFHKKVPREFIFEVFDTMNKANQHRFQILTKRADRIEKLNDKLSWSPNIWMGVSVESERYLYRIERLRATNAAIKFVSFEPLIAPINKVNLNGMNWVIVGGESGPGARPMDYEWVVSIRDKCISEGTPFLFKQWGGVFKKKTGRILDGRTWDEMPDNVCVYSHI
jgi:protein gp37